MNPTAFPVRTSLPAAEHRDRPTQEGPHEWQYPGMSLRDYFAAKALAGFLAHPEQDEAPLLDRNVSMLATEAYRLADAMLAARAKGGAA